MNLLVTAVLALVPAQDSPAELLPPSTYLYVEAPGLADLLESGLDHAFLRRLLDSELGRAVIEETGKSPAKLLAEADAWLGQSVLASLATLTGRGVAVGAMGGSRCLIARGADADSVRKTWLGVLARIAEQMGLEPAYLQGAKRNVGNADIWKLGDSVEVALDGEWMFVSANDGTVEQLIERRTHTASRLTDDERFQSARAGSPSDGLVWAWIDLEQMSASELGEFRKISREPAVHFLLGPVIATAGTARELTGALVLEDRRLALDFQAIGTEDGVLRELLPSGQEGEARPPRIPDLPGAETATGLFYRDLATIFQEREDLFPPRAQPPFAEATSGLALFFGGADVADEVLPALSPWIGAVVRDARFTDAAVPDVPLPALALMTRVDPDSRVGPRLVGAFQTAIGIINIENAQKMGPSMLLGLELAGGVTVTTARFPDPAAGAGVDMRYNLAPACALVGDTFVLGSHHSLVLDLVNELGRDSAGPVARPSSDALTLSGAQVAAVIEANEAALAMQGVLEEGKTHERARADVRALALAAGMIERLRVDTRNAESGILGLSVSLELTPE